MNGRNWPFKGMNGERMLRKAQNENRNCYCRLRVPKRSAIRHRSQLDLLFSCKPRAKANSQPIAGFRPWYAPRKASRPTAMLDSWIAVEV